MNNSEKTQHLSATDSPDIVFLSMSINPNLSECKHEIPLAEKYFRA